MTELNMNDPIFIDIDKGPETYSLAVFTHDTIQQVPLQSLQLVEQTPQQSNMEEPVDKVQDVENPEPLPPNVKVVNEMDTWLASIQPRRHKCPDCKRFTAETEEKLLRHIKKVHRGENPFSCFMCDYSTYNNVLFDEHVRIHQGIKPFKCTYCPYKSVSKKNAKKHELIHRPDNPLKCPKCSFIARHNRALKCHEVNCQGSSSNQDVKCDICDYVTNKSHMSYHRYSMHGRNMYECQYCKYTVKSKVLMRKHKATVHKKTMESKKDKIKKPEFKCRICKWESTHKPKILLHLIHHPNQKIDEKKFDISILKKFGIMS